MKNKANNLLKNDAAKLNPCLKEQEQTYKCFSDKDYNKELCTLEIENYKTCKSFWGFVKAYRRKNGITPYLPPVEEREQVKRELLSQFTQ